MWMARGTIQSRVPMLVEISAGCSYPFYPIGQFIGVFNELGGGSRRVTFLQILPPKF